MLKLCTTRVIEPTTNTHMALCGHPVKTALKLGTPQSAVSQQQPMSQKPGVKSQRHAGKHQEKGWTCLGVLMLGVVSPSDPQSLA